MSPEPSCHKNIPGYRNLVTNIGDKFSRRHTKKLGPSAVLMRAGTSLITIFLVTLSFRNLQPLIKSLGLLDSPDRPKRLRCHQHPYGGRRKSRSIYHAPKKRVGSMLVKKPAKSWLNQIRSARSGVTRKILRRAHSRLMLVEQVCLSTIRLMHRWPAETG